MQRASVFVFVVALALATGVDVEAGSGGVVSALKQRSATLLIRWQQRVGVSPRAKALLQVGMAAAFCTTFACGGVTQSPEMTGGEAPAVSEAPEVQSSKSALIRTELFGEGFVTSRGLTYESITAYGESKEKLPVQFYDGMMVIQVRNGKDFVRIVDLIDGKILKVRHIGHASYETVDYETITGVLVGTHPDYGTRYVSFAAEFARPVNNDGGDQLLAALPEGTTFYGEPNVIFSNGDYAITVYAFSLVGDQMLNFPRDVRFIVNSEHLVTIDRPANFPSPLQRGIERRPPQRLRKNNATIAHYRADDEGLAPLLLVSDSVVLLSK